MDNRIADFAKLIVTTSTSVKRGENVLIQITDEGRDLATEIYKEVVRAGAHPLIITTPSEAMRGYYEIADDDTLVAVPNHYFQLIKNSDVIIFIRSESNTKNLNSIDPNRISTRNKALKDIREERLSKRWCLTQYPTVGYAQDAEMSLKEYQDFVYSAILIDWNSQYETMKRLKEIMDRTDKVRLIGLETDLTFSIKGRNAVVGGPIHNVPGGEVFTAPIEDSAEGKILFDLPSVRYGREVEGIRLKFEKGEVVDYSAEKNVEVLKRMIETDDGAKRLGELGIGTNRGIKKYTKNILFDEKIGDTIHLALGRSYKECGGQNDSAIHLDMIKTMKPGKIIMDGLTIQENGKFFWE